MSKERTHLDERCVLCYTVRDSAAFGRQNGDIEKMKLLIASDIHGDASAAQRLVEIFRQGGFDKLLLLGDILYHGPRNDLPAAYDPKAVIACLSPLSDRILAVRGNCESEVDQMVLPFPVMADYALLSLDGLTVFATHGHHHNMTTPPPLSRGDILLHGHTHVYADIPFGDGNRYLNPGSPSLPKEHKERTYLPYEGRVFRLMTLDGEVLHETVL